MSSLRELLANTEEITVPIFNEDHLDRRIPFDEDPEGHFDVQVGVHFRGIVPPQITPPLLQLPAEVQSTSWDWDASGGDNSTSHDILRHEEPDEKLYQFALYPQLPISIILYVAARTLFDTVRSNVRELFKAPSTDQRPSLLPGRIPIPHILLDRNNPQKPQ